MKTPEIYFVCTIKQGALSVMPKPSSEHLEADILHYKSLGVTKILCLLESQEIKHLGLENQEALCISHSLLYQNVPIVDRGVPELSLLKTLIPQLLDEIEKGAHLAIHCYGGVGRTGTVANCLLIASGMSATQALDKIHQSRQCKSPNIPEQIQCINEYFQHLQDN